KGQDGRDGVDGSSVTSERQPDGSVKVYNVSSTGQRTEIATIRNGVDGTNGRDGAKGQDGTNGSSVVSELQPDGSVKVYNVSSTGDRTEIATIRNGVDGRDGAKGQDGTNGSSVVSELQPDGSVKVYNVSSTGQRTEIATIRNGVDGRDGAKGQDGKNGVDGKSPLVEQVEVREGDKVIGTTIIIKDGDGNEVSRQTILNGVDGKDGKNGADGKSAEVTVTPGTDQNGNPGQTITIVKPDGTQETTFIRDGKDGAKGQDGKNGVDGKSPLVEQVEVREGDKVIGTTIIIKDGDGNEISRQTILNGQDGKNGADGKSAEVTVTPGTDQNGNPGQTITIVKPDGSRETTFVRDGKDGAKGQDGK
ncbi:TPA: hypothetical protein ACGOTT_002348, partial [Streptococcus suis]